RASGAGTGRSSAGTLSIHRRGAENAERSAEKKNKLDGRRGFSPRLSLRGTRLRVLCLRGEVVFVAGERLLEGVVVFFQVLGGLGAAQNDAVEAAFEDESEGVGLGQIAVF